MTTKIKISNGALVSPGDTVWRYSNGEIQKHKIDRVSATGRWVYLACDAFNLHGPFALDEIFATKSSCIIAKICRINCQIDELEIEVKKLKASLGNDLLGSPSLDPSTV